MEKGMRVSDVVDGDCERLKRWQAAADSLGLGLEEFIRFAAANHATHLLIKKNNPKHTRKRTLEVV